MSNATFSLLNGMLPFSLGVGDRDSLVESARSRPHLAHQVLDVEDERRLAEVSVDHLAGSLKANRRIQVRLNMKEN